MLCVFPSTNKLAPSFRTVSGITCKFISFSFLIAKTFILCFRLKSKSCISFPIHSFGISTSIIEVEIPKEWIGKEIQDLDLKTKTQK